MADESRPTSNFTPRASKGLPKQVDPVVDELVDEAPDYQPEWGYRWDVSEVSTPPLCERILEELQALMAQSSPQAPLILIRGEMGIGKSVLADQIHEGCSRISASGSKDLRLVQVLEADDLESPREFAGRINEATGGEYSHPTIVLGRPSTLDHAITSVDKTPSATATMLTFRVNTPLFRACLAHIGDRERLTPTQRRLLEDIARTLQDFMQTPFYYLEIARAVARGGGQEHESRSPLELFDLALDDRRLGREVFVKLLEAARGHGRTSGHGVVIQGVTDGDGFIHDGYRNIVLALGVLKGDLHLGELVRARNSEPAFRLLLAHLSVKAARSDQSDDTTSLLASALAEFVEELNGLEDVPYIVYLQALAAPVVDAHNGDDRCASAARSRCIALIEEMARKATQGEAGSQGLLSSLESPSLWMDVSDALAIVSDPRLEKARMAEFGPESGYFTFVENQEVEIGANGVVPRNDFAKPVAPYARQTVRIGDVWVANYLVTNEQYAQFARDHQFASFFEGTGQQWLEKDPDLIERIGEMFELSAKRNYWKELKEQPVNQNISSPAGSRSILEVAEARARNERRIDLWDPASSDSRFSARGKPVVGVNWWEALAFCKWWEEQYVDQFPAGSQVNLLTDWEWEGVRRLYFISMATPFAKAQITSRSFPVHLRKQASSLSRRQQPLLRSSSLQPRHVGLYPAPSGSGPLDLVGNVWEWTRSRVFGSIVVSKENDETFGPTAWDTTFDEKESQAEADDRDVTEELNDLSYRATRGSSFFSHDPEAAWHPAYRLCDPPFTSYFDLGFRIAVYPPG